MPLSIYDLGLRFHYGKKSGQSSRSKIVDKPGDTLLVDFGWAVLAKRNKGTGKVTYYEGWKGYSRSTSRHIKKTSLPYKADIIKNERPTLNSISLSDETDLFRQKYSDVFIDPLTNKLRLIRRKK